MAPRQGKTQFQLDKDAVVASFLSLEGKHLVILALSGVDDVMTVLTSDNDGNVVLRVSKMEVSTDMADQVNRFEMTATRTEPQRFL